MSGQPRKEYQYQINKKPQNNKLLSELEEFNEDYDGQG